MQGRRDNYLPEQVLSSGLPKDFISNELSQGGKSLPLQASNEPGPSPSPRTKIWVTFLEEKEI